MAAAFCSKCLKSRMLNVSAKCDDKCDVTINGRSECGYVPSGLNIGSGDYLFFSLCLNCGHVDGKFPLDEHELEQDERDEEEDER